MSVIALASKGNHVHTIQRNAQGVIIGENRYDADGFGVGNFDPPGSAFQEDVSGDSDMDSAYGGGIKAKRTVEWSAFTAESAPTSETTASLGPERCSVPVT